MGKRACLLLWNAYVNVLGKQLCTVDKGRFCGCGVELEVRQHCRVYCLVLGEGEITTTKIQNTKYCYTGPPTWTGIVWVLAGIMSLKKGCDGMLL